VVFDTPELIVACVFGDGEAETGPLASAWHLSKFLDPVTDGAVLPILHLDGHKIANPTVLARITHEELEQFLRDCGWTPLFVEGHEPASMHEAMAAALDTAVEQIRAIQRDAPGSRHYGSQLTRTDSMSLKRPTFCFAISSTTCPGRSVAANCAKPRAWNTSTRARGPTMALFQSRHPAPTRDKSASCSGPTSISSSPRCRTPSWNRTQHPEASACARGTPGTDTTDRSRGVGSASAATARLPTTRDAAAKTVATMTVPAKVFITSSSLCRGFATLHTLRGGCKQSHLAPGRRRQR